MAKREAITAESAAGWLSDVDPSEAGVKGQARGNVVAPLVAAFLESGKESAEINVAATGRKFHTLMGALRAYKKGGGKNLPFKPTQVGMPDEDGVGGRIILLKGDQYIENPESNDEASTEGATPEEAFESAGV